MTALLDLPETLWLAADDISGVVAILAGLRGLPNIKPLSAIEVCVFTVSEETRSLWLKAS